MSEFSKQYREKLLPGQKHAFADTDPEFVQIFESFAFDEVVNQGDLDERTRFMAILAALLAGYEAVGIEVTDAYYKLGSDRARFALSAHKKASE